MKEIEKVLVNIAVVVTFILCAWFLGRESALHQTVKIIGVKADGTQTEYVVSDTLTHIDCATNYLTRK